jgi:nucleoside-diphosphate-sugar epimerase
MKIVLIGANGKIGELVQKALAGAGHEIVKVGRKSGDFRVEIENRKPSARLMPWPLQQAKSHLLRFRNSPLKSGSFRWEAN